MILFISCNKIVDASQNIYDETLFNNDKSNCDQITIRLYTQKSKMATKVYNTLSTEKVYKATSQNQIKSFDKIFENAEKTNYCCCPKANYSIEFLKSKKVLNTYFVDTIEFKNRVRIYEERWQYSFIIEKQKWKNYLNEINN